MPKWHDFSLENNIKSLYYMKGKDKNEVIS